MILSFMIIFILSANADPVTIWDHFEKSVRDQEIVKERAKEDFLLIYRELKRECNKYPFNPDSKWLFPVKGYGKKDMGAAGFRPDIRYGSSPIKGYDFYDGNLHGGHPAYDIFIHDKNQDTIDDLTDRHVEVIAPLDIMILSIESSWEPGSEIRGGRYIWALDPVHDYLIYFAHLNEVKVKPGEFINAGTTIGTVGRSGTNAFPVRSPTHLHLMVLKIKGNVLEPVDYLIYLN